VCSPEGARDYFNKIFLSSRRPLHKRILNCYFFFDEKMKTKIPPAPFREGGAPDTPFLKGVRGI